MSREIKFRALVNGKWEYYILPQDAGYMAGRFKQKTLKHLTIFTGLLDKNGKGIYEGDVANITFYVHGTPITERGVMEFTKEAYFGFKVENSLFNDNQKNLEIEIIGNIYENPDLTPEKGE